MAAFLIGLAVGVTLGVIVVAFLAVDAYERGFGEALLRRKAWRAELVAREATGRHALSRLRRAS